MARERCRPSKRGHLQELSPRLQFGCFLCHGTSLEGTVALTAGCLSSSGYLWAIRWFMFRRRRFPVDIILGCVRWYCKYGISYPELTEMMQEGGVEVDPSTIMRWVHQYAPELDAPTTSSVIGVLKRWLFARTRVYSACTTWRTLCT